MTTATRVPERIPRNYRLLAIVVAGVMLIASAWLGSPGGVSADVLGLPAEPPIASPVQPQRPAVLVERTHRESGSDAGGGVDALGVEWHWHRTPHFHVAHRGHAAEADRRGALLERTHARFHEAFADAGFDLAPLSQPLTCLVFADRKAMIHYGRDADDADVAWTAAYYSARTNRIALVEPRPLKSPARAMGAVQPEIHPLTHDRIATASTTHEAAHQLAFNTGLQRRGVTYPLWISEGLATNFELDADSRRGHDHPDTFGPDRDNPLRRRHLADAFADDALLPLNEMITLVAVPIDDADAVRRIYAQSWGLFRFLFETHPARLHALLRHLHAQHGQRLTPAQLRAAFVTHIGPIREIDREWQAWLAMIASR